MSYLRSFVRRDSDWPAWSHWLPKEDVVNDPAVLIQFAHEKPSEKLERIHMQYVDGFVIPVSKKKLAAYTRMAKKACKIWMEHGALDYRECVGDDLNIKHCLPFPKGIKAKAGEAIVFAYIVYKSRAHRDKVNAKVMKDPRIASMCDPKDMPFDCKRMLYGGFKVIVGSQRK